MRVFVTGATGFIGSAIVRELQSAGHKVLGLARSDEAAEKLRTTRVEVHRGSLEDLETLKRGAQLSDGVVHTAFIHDFSNFMASVETDRRVIETMGAALEGSGRPLVIASGTLMVAGQPGATEDTVGSSQNPRGAAEMIVVDMASRGVRSAVVRLSPLVHGEGDRHGFTVRLLDLARRKGVSGYVGDGLNRWPAVHRMDAVSIFVKALEKGHAGSRYHAAGDEGIPFLQIAEAIGRKVGVPAVSIPAEKAAEHFEFLGMFVGFDNLVSTRLTCERLNWTPIHRSLIEDIEHGSYS